MVANPWILKKKKKKKKKKTQNPKPNILKSKTNGWRNQTLIDVERKKDSLPKEKNLTQYTEIRNQRTTPSPRATANRAHRHITSGLKLKLQPPEHIGSEIGLPCLDVLPDGGASQPQASLLPQPHGISYLHLTSLSFSLLHIWVIGLMGFFLSQFLSLYLKNESEMK